MYMIIFIVNPAVASIDTNITFNIYRVGISHPKYYLFVVLCFLRPINK